jgi:hypothetical protein
VCPFLADGEPCRLFSAGDPFITNVIAVAAARVGAGHEPHGDANLSAGSINFADHLA